MRLAIVGSGTAVPEHSITQEEAVELHSTLCEVDPERSRTLRALYRRSGVVRRHSVLLERSSGPLLERQTFYPPALDDRDLGPGTDPRMERYAAHAPALAAEASASALRAAGLSGRDITHIVTVSCTGFMAPGVDARLIESLGLPRTTLRTHVGFMGCHGALNGLRVAESIVRTDADAIVLVCAVELCSLHFAYGWNPEMMVPNALFADGAAALVVRASPHDSACWTLKSSASLLIPDTADDMSWRIGDHGFRMALSARVPDVIAASLGEWLSAWLCDQGLAIGEVGSWAIHPGGPRILGAVERAAGLDRPRTLVSREVLAAHGNMSSATVFFTLHRLRSEGAPGPCVALALGPGLVAEAVLFA